MGYKILPKKELHRNLQVYIGMQPLRCLGQEVMRVYRIPSMASADLSVAQSLDVPSCSFDNRRVYFVLLTSCC